jgi:hypothetical protein
LVVSSPDKKEYIMPPQEDRLVFIGVDVAKAILAIQFPDQAWSTANTAQGHALFLKRLQSFGQVQVVCEATGGYERPWSTPCNGPALRSA